MARKLLMVCGGVVCCACIVAIIMLTISDNGAIITGDRFPPTSPLTYVLLVAGAAVSGVIAFAAADYPPEKRKGEKRNKKPTLF